MHNSHNAQGGHLPNSEFFAICLDPFTDASLQLQSILDAGALRDPLRTSTRCLQQQKAVLQQLQLRVALLWSSHLWRSTDRSW